MKAGRGRFRLDIMKNLLKIRIIPNVDYIVLRGIGLLLNEGFQVELSCISHV